MLIFAGVSEIVLTHLAQTMSSFNLIMPEFRLCPFVRFGALLMSFIAGSHECSSHILFNSLYHFFHIIPIYMSAECAECVCVSLLLVSCVLVSPFHSATLCLYHGSNKLHYHHIPILKMRSTHMTGP